jgi:hypothetical protein
MNRQMRFGSHRLLGLTLILTEHLLDGIEAIELLAHNHSVYGLGPEDVQAGRFRALEFLDHEATGLEH